MMTTATGLFAVLALAGCQQKQVVGFTVSASGSVRIDEIASATLDVNGPNLTVVKPDPAKLLAQAKRGVKAYVGPGVSKPVVTLQRVGTSTYVLDTSQQMANTALLSRHFKQFDAASLSLDVRSTSTAPPDPNDPLGLKGPRREMLTVEAGDSSDAGAEPTTVAVTHHGDHWSFVLAETAKDFAADKKMAASLATQEAMFGLPASALKAEIHVKLPGKITATNGRRLGHGVVSFNLLALPSRTLWVKSTG